MKMIFDNEYEKLDVNDLRSNDINKYCLFNDTTGYNVKEAVLDPHWNEWLEVTYVIDGWMSVITPQGSYEVKKGDVIVIGMQTLHKLIGHTGNYRYQCMHINVGFILQYFSPILLNEKILMIENKRNFLEYYSSIIKLMKHDDVSSQLKYKAALLNLLSICVDEVETKKENGTYNVNDVFSSILFYVSTHYHEDISLQDLSTRFGYSTQHISLMFKKKLSVNYYKYLTKIRLDKARFLLMTSSKKIIDIAFECGFPNEHSLINHFKKVYGETPTQYRKKEKNKL